MIKVNKIIKTVETVEISLEDLLSRTLVEVGCMDDKHLDMRYRISQGLLGRMASIRKEDIQEDDWHWMINVCDPYERDHRKALIQMLCKYEDKIIQTQWPDIGEF